MVDLFDAAGGREDRSSRRLSAAAKPLEGASAFATFRTAEAATRTEQYYELGGMRAYPIGKLATDGRTWRGEPFESDKWGLYDMSREPNELTNVSARRPDASNNCWRGGIRPRRATACCRSTTGGFDPTGAGTPTRRRRALLGFAPPIEHIAHDVGPTVRIRPHPSRSTSCRRPAAATACWWRRGRNFRGWVIYIAGGKLIRTGMVPSVSGISARTVAGRKARAPLHAEDDGAAFRRSRRHFVDGAKVSETELDRCILSPSYDGLSVGAVSAARFRWQTHTPIRSRDRSSASV